MLKLWFAVVVLWLFVPACGSKDALEDTSQLTDETEQRLNGVAASNEGKDGFPEAPRRQLAFESEASVDGGLQLGIKVEGFGAEVESTTQMTFGKMHKTSLMIFKYTPNLNESIYREENGTYYLDAPPEAPMVAICYYAAYLTTNLSNLNQLTIAGNGAVNTNSLKDSTSVTQSTDFFKVESGQTVKEWLAKCDEIYNRDIVASIERDLSAATANMRLQVKQDQCLIPSSEEMRTFSDGKRGDRACESTHLAGLSSVAAHSTSRCVASSSLGEGLGFCRLRAVRGASCSLYKDNATGVVYGSAGTGRKLVTSGMFEYPCDSGLSCVVAEEGGWFTDWQIYKSYVGQCR